MATQIGTVSANLVACVLILCASRAILTFAFEAQAKSADKNFNIIDNNIYIYKLS